MNLTVNLEGDDLALLMLNMFVGDMPMKFLIDTGANINIVSPILTKALSLKPSGDKDEITLFSGVRFAFIHEDFKATLQTTEFIIKEPRKVDLSFTGVPIVGVLGTKFLIDNHIQNITINR